LYSGADQRCPALAAAGDVYPRRHARRKALLAKGTMTLPMLGTNRHKADTIRPRF